MYSVKTFSVKTRTAFGLAAAAVVALSLSAAVTGSAAAGSPQASTQKMVQLKKRPVNPRPTGGVPQAIPGKIASKPVVIGDHAWVQFWDVKTGEDTGCHDIDNQTSCEGTCPCN